MAKQPTLKQQLIQELANQQVAQYRQAQQQNDDIAQLQAQYAAWQNEQEVAALQQQYNAWIAEQQKAQQPVQTVTPKVAQTPVAQPKIPSINMEDYQRQQQEESMLQSGDKFAKAKRERNQRQQHEEQMLAEKGTPYVPIEDRIANVDRLVPQETKKLSKKDKELEEQILNADKYNLPEKKEEKKSVTNPFMSDYLSIRTENDLNKDRKAIQTSEVIKKYAEAKGISEEQAMAEFEKAEAMKGQSISAPGTRDLASLEATDRAKVDLQTSKYLDPTKKLHDQEKKDARELAQAELAKFEYGADKKPLLRTDEERQHYADMVNLLNKTNPVANTMTGYIQQPLNLARMVRDAGRSVGNGVTGFGSALTDKAGLTEGATQRHNERVEAADNFYDQNDANMDKAYQNALTQNPVLTKGGNFAGNMTMYTLTNPVFDSLGAVAGLGKAGSFALNQVGQNLQDIALDTLPTLNRYAKDGELTDAEKWDLALGGLVNAGGNLAMGGAGLAIDKLKGKPSPELDEIDRFMKNVTDQANEATQTIENLSKQVPKVPEAVVEDAIKNADEAVESATKSVPMETAKAQPELPKKNLDLPGETEARLNSDFEMLYGKELSNDAIAIEKLGNEKVTEAYTRLKKSLADYERAAYRAENIEDVTTARRAVDSARQNLNRVAKREAPDLKLETRKSAYGKLIGNPEYRRAKLLGPDEAWVDEFIKESDEYEKSLESKKYARDAEPIEPARKAEDNLVMAEDIGIEQPKPEKIESYKIEEEVPPTKPETTDVEDGDYVSKFRTHNEQNFNMTDEELNSKYFNTQNENFHFLKGDRAADLENATRNLETNYDETVNKLLTKSRDTQFTPQEVDEGFMAWNRELQAARETGDYGKSADIMYRMTQDAHDKGAGLGAYAAWKKNSPAGVVLDASEKARGFAVDKVGKKYVEELDKLTDQIDNICKSGDSLDDKIKQIDKLMKDAKGKGYKNGISGAEQMAELLKTGDNIDVSHIHDILYEANKVPNLSAQSQAEIAQIASEMYGKQLTDAEKRQYINQINMILSNEKHWSIKDKAVEISHILMLSGTRTHLKNFVANVGMLPQEALARKISAIGQNGYKAIIDHDYKPTQAFHVSKTSKKLAEEMYNAKGGANAIVENVADKYTNRLADRIGATYMFGSGKKNIAAKANDAAQNLIPGLKKVEDAAADMANKALKKMGSEGAYDAMDANVSILENYRQFIYGSLSGLEDNPFVKKNYIDRLASYIEAQKIKNINDIPEDALDIARAEALKATFKDDNAITELVQSFKKLPGIGELMFPFTKTPANLLARSIDFSPIGLARSIYGAANKNSQFAKETVGETIDEISKGLGGTATMALGMWLYANGLITGKKSDDADIANYMANEGWQQYSLSTKGIADFVNSRLGTDLDWGDDYYDFSFLQPSTTNMIAAEEVWDELMDGKKISEKTADDIFNRVKSVAGSYTDALLAQSTLQNVGELFGSQYSDDGVGGNLIQNALEYPTRFTSGAISDLAKLNDNTKREYYSKNKPLETVKNAVVSKLPFLSKTLPEKYDAFGNVLERNQSEGKNWINTLANPSTTTHRNTDPLYDYVDSLNNESTSGDYVPSKPLRKIKLDDETELSLDNKQYSKASKVAGEARKKILNDIQNNDLYNSLDANDRVAVLDRLEKVATNKGYLSVADNAKVTDEAKKIMDEYKLGGVDAVVNDYVSRKMVKESGLSSSSNAAKEIQKAVNSGNIVKANKIADAEGKTKTAITDAGLEMNDTTRAVYESNGEAGLKDYKVFRGYTNGYEAYKRYEASGSTKTAKAYNDTLKKIDGFGDEGKINGEITQKEMLAYFDANDFTQEEANMYWKTYGKNYGDDAWKALPVLKNGKWTAKKQK